MKPRILLSVNSKRDNYIDAVNNCGGIAVPQYCPDVSDEYDGLIICGGNDIDGLLGSVGLGRTSPFGYGRNRAARGGGNPQIRRFR